MGTTSQKLTYLNDTKQLLKQKINNLGGDITDETTFRQYANQLQNVYDNLPKTSYAEGTEITLENTLKGKLDFENDIVGYGDTKQTQYSGYNKMNTANATIGYKPEGTITINSEGVINASADMGYASINIPSITLKAGKTYTFKRSFTGSYNSYLVDTNNNNVLGIGYNKTSVIATFETDTVINKLNGALVSGDNYFWLYEDTTDKSFEPFVGNTASPNPSYPQEIEVVRGKNLFDINNTITLTRFGITATTNNETGEITLNGTATQNAFIQFGLNSEIKSGTILSLSANNPVANSGVRVRLTQDGGAVVGVETVLSNINAKVENIAPNKNANRLQIRVESGTTLTNYVIKPQLEKGSQATSYLPYNTVEIVESGKNKLKINDVTLTSNGVTLTIQDNYLILNGTNNGTESVFQLSNYITPFKTNSNTNLKAFQISGTASGSLVNTFFRTYSNWTNQVNVNFTQTTISSYSAELTYNNCMLALAGGTYTDYKIGIMVADNLTSDDIFEPYQIPQTYQLSLGEYEFAKIGNYVDTIEYDVENDKVYKNKAIGKVVFNGSETGWERNTTTLGYRYRINQLDIKPNVDNSTIASMYCNYLRATSPDRLYNNDNYSISCFSGTSHVIIIACIDTDTDTLEKWKTWLSTHNLEVYYVLAEALKEEITGTLKDQIKALYNSHSFTGTTIIEIDGDLPMIIKVRALKGE